MSLKIMDTQGEVSVNKRIQFNVKETFSIPPSSLLSSILLILFLKLNSLNAKVAII